LASAIESESIVSWDASAMVELDAAPVVDILIWEDEVALEVLDDLKTGVFAWDASALEVLNDLEVGELVWEDVDAGGGVADLAASVVGSVIEDTLLDSKS
jgi:hypothetical protein